jgi:hypothetical protein
MQSLATRAVLVLLALAGLLTGGWASFAPRSFYTDFPGVRRGYVAADGPFNEHLIRDVGAMFLALAALAVAALLVRGLLAARLAALAWVVFSVPHLTYHASHLDMFEPADQWANVIGLSLLVLLPLAVLIRPGHPAPRSHSAG